jgi:hypothetical protein
MHQPHPESLASGAIQLPLKLAFQLICNVAASFREIAVADSSFG